LRQCIRGKTLKSKNFRVFYIIAYITAHEYYWLSEKVMLTGLWSLVFLIGLSFVGLSIVSDVLYRSTLNAFAGLIRM